MQASSFGRGHFRAGFLVGFVLTFDMVRNKICLEKIYKYRVILNYLLIFTERIVSEFWRLRESLCIIFFPEKEQRRYNLKKGGRYNIAKIFIIFCYIFIYIPRDNLRLLCMCRFIKIYCSTKKCKRDKSLILSFFNIHFYLYIKFLFRIKLYH